MAGNTAYDRSSRPLTVTDNFNRSNSNPIGGNWTTIPNNVAMKIVSNTIQPGDVAQDSAAFYNAASFDSNQYSQIKITTSGTGASAGMGVDVRVAGDGSLYRLVATHAASNNVELRRFNCCSSAQIWQRTQAFTDGDTLRLEAQGTHLRAYLNGTQIGSEVIDTNIATGSPAVAFSSTLTSASGDDWEGGNLPNGHDGTLTNGAKVVLGKIGQAVDFDGVNDYVDLGAGSGINVATVKTVSAWIKPRTLGEGNFGTIMASDTNSQWYLQLCSNDSTECTGAANTLVYKQDFSGGTGEWRMPANSIQFNQWQHVVAVYDFSSASNERRILSERSAGCLDQNENPERRRIK